MKPDPGEKITAAARSVVVPQPLWSDFIQRPLDGPWAHGPRPWRPAELDPTNRPDPHPGPDAAELDLTDRPTDRPTPQDPRRFHRTPLTSTPWISPRTTNAPRVTDARQTTKKPDFLSLLFEPLRFTLDLNTIRNILRASTPRKEPQPWET